MAHVHIATGREERAASLIAVLRERPQVQVAAAYAGGAWLLYDVAELVVFAFDLPDGLLRGLLGLLASGFVLALFLGHWLRLTVLAKRGDQTEASEDIRGVPDFLEPALIRATSSVSRRTTLLATGSAGVAFAVLFLMLWSSWAAAHERQVPDPRVTVVVFPFNEAGQDLGGLGTGLADLLSVTLDGTPGLRVVDPSAAWRFLSTDQDGAPVAPDRAEALDVGRQIGARSVVTGDLLALGSRVEIGARVAVPDSDESVPIRLSAHRDSLGPALERLAVEVVAAAWAREQIPTVPEIERSATSSAAALRAYLEAKGAIRQGRLEAAREAIERALASDSTFALAHLERFLIEGQLLFAQAQPLAGLRPILESATRHAGRLTPRNRMRIDAHRAIDETDGSRAAFYFERILSIDSLDVDALNGLAYSHLVNGWQVGRGWDEVADAYQRVVLADSSNTEALATLARLALWRDDPASADRWLARLMGIDSLSPYARGVMGTYQILTADEVATPPLLTTWAHEEVAVVTTVLRDLRNARPALADRFLQELVADSLPTYHRRVGQGGRAQLWMAQGRPSQVDSLVQSGELQGLRTALAAYHVAAALIGVGDAGLAARSADELAIYTPLDSLEAYSESRDVWITGWAVAAYHATLGDTIEARTWQSALASLPPGETTVPEWPSALEADVEARLAARRGDPSTAESWARTAYERWSVHTFAALENHPEPAMRFHLAQLQQARDATREAEALFRSLAAPYTWMGFYTARASLEVGRILERAGRAAEAAAFYRRAVRLWESGATSVVGDWLEDARQGLARTAA